MVTENDAEFTKLPQWLQEQLPEVTPPSEIAYSNNTYTLTQPNGDTQNFQKLVEAYDYAKSHKQHVIINPSVPESNKEEAAMGMLTIPCENSDNRRVLFTSSEIDNLYSLMHKYNNFLKISEAYEKTPQDFMLSYSFIDSHPAFWIKEEHYIKDATDKTFHWDKNYAQKVWVCPTTDDEGNTVWMLEAGAHIEPEYVDHYHDYRLDVWEPTIEQAYIKLAENVSKFFNTDGTEKENVPYEKSELEITLEKTIAQLKLSKENDDNVE